MDLHRWTISLHSNEVEILCAIFTAVITLIAAFIAVRTAFKQITKQFENKVIFEGWTDFQDKLFSFSKSLSNYDTKIQWLTYFIKSQNNPLVNGGNLVKHRYDKWDEVIGEYAELQKAYVDFLRSYETHEIIFISLKKMHHEFIKEFRKRVDDKHMKLLEKIFPEMYGLTNTLSEKQLIKAVNDYWTESSEFSAFLDDFRRELQNVTVGKILNRNVPKRLPHEDKYKILTVNGFVFHNPSWKNRLNRLKKLLSNIIGSKRVH